MARQTEKLTALRVTRLKSEGLHSDGGGLYLQITGRGARSWIFRYRMGGRTTPRDMGLGSLDGVPLSDARKRAAEMRSLIASGIDPIDSRRAAEAQAELDRARALSFKDCAEAYIASHREGWKNPKHAAQWGATLASYAYPVIGKMPVAEVDIGHVLKVLEPIWKAKTETASRLRGRIEAVLDWARVRKYRSGENPARWRGNLEHQLPKPKSVQRVEHHPALPYVQVGAFLKDLRAQGGTAARAFEFLILTATRTSETLGARWDEIDLEAGTWTIPADRIKAGREHRVPLSGPALSILKAMAKERIENAEHVFPGGITQRPLSNAALLSVLRRMERTDITAHGFRSTFRDWAAERTNYSREVAEMALAHTIGDKVEAAYRRGDLFEKRRRLMDEWAKFCGTVAKGAEVVPLNRRAR